MVGIVCIVIVGLLIIGRCTEKILMIECQLKSEREEREEKED